MDLNVNDSKDARLVFSGMALGGMLMFLVMRRLKGKFIRNLIQNINLKTELLNWVITYGRNLERWEFEREFMEKAKFLDLVQRIEES